MHNQGKQGKAGGAPVQQAPVHILKQEELKHRLHKEHQLKAQMVKEHELKAQICHRIMTGDLERRKTHLPDRLKAISSPCSLHAQAHAQQSGQGGQDDGQSGEVIAFHRIIRDETVLAEAPAGSTIPLCNCGTPTQLVVYEPPEKAYAGAIGDSELANIPDVQMYVCSRAACGFVQELGPAEAPPTEQAQPTEHVITTDELGQMTLEEFWELVGGDGITPVDPEMATYCFGSDWRQQAHTCHCNETTTLTEDPEGDMFWVCTNKSCTYVVLCMLKPAADFESAFDLGDLVAPGQADHDRFAVPATILQWFGRAFSLAFMNDLMGAKLGEKEWPKRSCKLEERAEYDAFLSYRGGTGRFWLWVTLCAHFNVTAMFIGLFVVVPCLVILVWCMFPEPMYYLSSGFFTLTTYQKGNTIYNEEFDERGDGHPFHSIYPTERSWFLFLPYGLPVFAAMFWFWNPVATWFAKQPRIFFDKLCVHQSYNPTQIAGLLRMPLYLKNSAEVLAVFDAEYVKRLWCIFEIAVYLQLRKKPRVLFLNTSQKSLELITVSARLLAAMLVIVVNRQTMKDNGNKPAKEFFLWFRLVYDVSMSCVQFFLGQRWFKDMITLRETMATYDVRDAELTDPADRMLLLRLINHYWGETETHEQGGDSPAAAGFTSVAGTAPTLPAARTVETTRNVTAGLQKFNDNIRTQVRRILPVSGPRSWILFGYMASVVYYATAALYEYDNWAYHRIWDDEYEIFVTGAAAHTGNMQARKELAMKNSAKYGTLQDFRELSMYFSDLNQGIATILSLSVRLFVIGPISLFMLGMLVRFLLWLQKLSRLPYWASVIFALPVFLALECVFGVRPNIIHNLENLVSLACGSGTIVIAPTILSSFLAGRHADFENTFGSPFTKLIRWSSASTFYIGRVAFDPWAIKGSMWWPFVWRPFWGLYYMFLQYSGACMHGHAERNADDAPLVPGVGNVDKEKYWHSFTARGCLRIDPELKERHPEFDDGRKYVEFVDGSWRNVSPSNIISCALRFDFYLKN